MGPVSGAVEGFSFSVGSSERVYYIYGRWFVWMRLGWELKIEPAASGRPGGAVIRERKRTPGAVFKPRFLPSSYIVVHYWTATAGQVECAWLAMEPPNPCIRWCWLAIHSCMLFGQSASWQTDGKKNRMCECIPSASASIFLEQQR